MNIDQEKYLELMESRLQTYFEIEKDKMLEGEKFNLYGKYHMILGRTFLSKKDIIDKFETNEHVMIKCIDNLTQDDLERYLAYLSDLSKKLVNLNKYHKSTYLNFVLVIRHNLQCDLSTIKKYKYEKIFGFYLKGFCEVRLVVIELPTGKVFTNRDGKCVRKAYMPFYKK
ncbi:hypothetical protein [Cellulosilyticum ruminicola]|uniref:hypothetical protein n=1 Tax=Cellulosilyticum ruminicola TaxID=425254 RepID=UPI0006D0ACC6|nr:hypothetical protein [Cellulosilyticum ruminicola]